MADALQKCQKCGGEKLGIPVLLTKLLMAKIYEGTCDALWQKTLEIFHIAWQHELNN